MFLKKCKKKRFYAKFYFFLQNIILSAIIISMEKIDSNIRKKIDELYDKTDVTYLIFSIHDHRYALKSSMIQEIMYGAKVHKLPFVPDYIEGVLNCRGNPYTVINTLKMDHEENPEIKEKVFLLFKRDDDQFSIHISNIEVFFEPEDDAVHEDKVKYKTKFIPLFDSDRVEEVMCMDLGKED